MGNTDGIGIRRDIFMIASTTGFRLDDRSILPIHRLRDWYIIVEAFRLREYIIEEGTVFEI